MSEGHLLRVRAGIQWQDSTFVGSMSKGYRIHICALCGREDIEGYVLQRLKNKVPLCRDCGGEIREQIEAEMPLKRGQLEKMPSNNH